MDTLTRNQACERAEKLTWPIAGLIAQGPDDDGGVVLVPLQHAHASVDDGMHPDGVLGRHHAVVVQRWVKAMRLHIGLIHQVQPVLIAQLIPADTMCLLADHGIYYQEGKQVQGSDVTA